MLRMPLHLNLQDTRRRKVLESTRSSPWKMLEALQVYRPLSSRSMFWIVNELFTIPCFVNRSCFFTVEMLYLMDPGGALSVTSAAYQLITGCGYPVASQLIVTLVVKACMSPLGKILTTGLAKKQMVWQMATSVCLTQCEPMLLEN